MASRTVTPVLSSEDGLVPRWWHTIWPNSRAPPHAENSPLPSYPPFHPPPPTTTTRPHTHTNTGKTPHTRVFLPRAMEVNSSGGVRIASGNSTVLRLSPGAAFGQCVQIPAPHTHCKYTPHTHRTHGAVVLISRAGQGQTAPFKGDSTI